MDQQLLGALSLTSKRKQQTRKVVSTEGDVMRQVRLLLTEFKMTLK